MNSIDRKWDTLNWFSILSWTFLKNVILDITQSVTQDFMILLLKKTAQHSEEKPKLVKTTLRIMSGVHLYFRKYRLRVRLLQKQPWSQTRILEHSEMSIFIRYLFFGKVIRKTGGKFKFQFNWQILYLIHAKYCCRVVWSGSTACPTFSPPAIRALILSSHLTFSQPLNLV